MGTIEASSPWYAILIAAGHMLFLALAAGLFFLVNPRLLARRRVEIDQYRQVEGALRERVKELDCLYGVSRLIERPGAALEEILQGIVELVPSAWQHPEIAGARISLDGQEFCTQNWQETAWCQSADISVRGTQVGTVQVCYLEPRPVAEGPFLKEERFLLDIVAWRVGRVVERLRAETEREQAENALRESEQRLRAIGDNLPAGQIYQLRVEPDGTSRFTYVSGAVEQLHECTAEQVIADPSRLFGRVVEQDRDGMLLATEKSIREMSVYDHEVRIRRKSGEIRWHRMTSRPRLIADGAVLFDGIDIDVTERKRAEEVVRLRLRLMEFSADHSLEELMQCALDEIGELTGSPIGFYHFVEDDQQTLLLQAWSSRTLQEFCRAEGKGMHYSLDQAGVWVDCVHQRRPVIHNDYAALPHRKGLPEGHAEVRRELVVPTMRDGRIVSILGVGNKATDYDERDVELVAYVTDVIWSTVERRRTEEQLQAYQRQLEAQNLKLGKLSLAIEQSGDTVIIADASGAVEYVNPRFEETTGYAAGEVMGKNLRILKSGEQDADFYRHLWTTIAGGETWRGEFRNRRKDGTLYWESTTIAPVLDAAGRITHYAAISQDITERREAEEALRRYAEQLAMQNAELDAFAHTVAHDLKNPLGVVIGLASLLEQEYVTMPADQLHEALQTALRSSKKLNVIIDELLLLASVRKAEMSLEPLAMADIVQGACERLQLVIKETGAHVIVPESTAWPVALGHAPWVEEVWANYISNALRYGGEPPCVEIGWGEPPEGMPASLACFWVRDNGRGLTAEAQAKLFASFTDLGQVRAKGHGLGLSIVRRIVTKLGGQVGVESAPGQGSRFYFSLPVAPVVLS